MGDVQRVRGQGDQVNTVCHDCGGDGRVGAARMIVSSGVASTAWVASECPTCEGDGWLPGLQPPV